MDYTVSFKTAPRRIWNEPPNMVNPPASGSRQRRLLIRPGAIGDFIVSLPALEALRSDWTEVWCAGQNVPLARFADQAISIAAAGLDRLGFLPADDVIDRLRSFDYIISWYGSNSPAFQALTRDTLRLNITFLPALPNDGEHAAEFYRKQAIGLGTGQVARSPLLPCPKIPRTFAAIHPFASGTGKQVPRNVFERAAESLARTMPVHWLRGPEDELRDAIHIPDLYDLGCWLAGARVFVGNDSGIAHLAAAVRTPVMALFPVTNPRQWAPRGPVVAANRWRRSNIATALAAG